MINLFMKNENLEKYKPQISNFFNFWIFKTKIKKFNVKLITRNFCRKMLNETMK
jgi:hypothetical protein